MTIKIEPGISLDKMKKEAPEKALEKESESPVEGRDELVTPEPTGEEGDAVTLEGDAEEEGDGLVKQAESTIEITQVSGGDKGGSTKTEEKKVGDKVIKEGSRVESREETSGVVGELFTQLVGEVEKINEGVQNSAVSHNSVEEKEHKMADDAENDDRDEDIDLTISFATAITGAIEDAPKDMEDMEVELEPKSVADPKRSKHSPSSKNGEEDGLGEPEKRSNGGEDEEDESAPSKQSDDWLPEDALEEDIDGEDEYFETNGAAEEE